MPERETAPHFDHITIDLETIEIATLDWVGTALETSVVFSTRSE